jgi:thiol-disulfide isomerase/thioredoxin
MATGRLLGVVLLITLGLSGCEEPPPPLKVRTGQVVPALAVQDLQQQPVTLRPTSGKLLMLNVWATWCAPCRHEMPSLQRLQQALGDDAARLELVGLSVDQDAHVAREYLIEHRIAFPSLLDRNFAAVNGVFGVRVFPSTFFIAPDGTLRQVIEGWRDWDTPEMVAKIRALLPPAGAVSAQKPQPAQG